VSEQFGGAEAERRKLTESRINFGVADIFGMKLRLDPVFEARFLNLFDLPRSRAEAEPVQCVQDSFLLVQFLDRKFAGEVFLGVAFIFLGWIAR